MDPNPDPDPHEMDADPKPILATFPDFVKSQRFNLIMMR